MPNHIKRYYAILIDYLKIMKKLQQSDNVRFQIRENLPEIKLIRF
jgi:hypothetical protein